MVLLESHYYGNNGPAIKHRTRNTCSNATVKILEEMASILFPNEEIEVYVLPAQDGCHQDTFWVKAKNHPITTATAIVTLFSAIIGLPLINSQIRVNDSQVELNYSQVEVNKSQELLNTLEAEKLRQELKKMDIKLEDNQIQRVIENKIIKENTANHFQQLQLDKEIREEKIIAKSEKNTVISEKKVKRKDFILYTNAKEENDYFYEHKLHKLIIISPVNSASSEAQWHTRDSFSGEAINFYMKDDIFIFDFLNNGKYPLKETREDDCISALIEYKVDKVTKKVLKKSAIKIYQFNDIEIEKIPEDISIEVVEKIKIGISDDQMSFLDFGTK